MRSNELICRFIGYEVSNMNEIVGETPGKKSKAVFGHPTAINHGGAAISLDSCKYHCSWDEIMFVVEVIEAMGYKFQICRKRVDIREDNKDQSLILSVKEASKQQSVYKAVIEFIEWHNLNS